MSTSTATSRSATHAFAFQAGGILSADALSYVVRRETDTPFHDALQRGEYCNVLHPPQTGKGSLRVRVMAWLQAEGVACVELNLRGLVKRKMSREDFCRAATRTILTQTPQIDSSQFDDSREWASLDACFDLLLSGLQTPLVVFLNEIDSLLALDFRDEFLHRIRLYHDRRTADEGYRRLTFALIGAVSPEELIADPAQSPFAIGRAIPLPGLPIDRAMQVLGAGLAAKCADRAAVLREIFSWTAGQPYLTQLLCDLARQQPTGPETDEEAAWVQNLVQTRIVEAPQFLNGHHVSAIQDRLAYSPLAPFDLSRTLYLRVLRKEKVLTDGSPAQTALLLSGLVRENAGRLEVANRIYAAALNQAWVERNLGEPAPRRTKAHGLTEWLTYPKSAIALGLGLFATLAALGFAGYQARQSGALSRETTALKLAHLAISSRDLDRQAALALALHAWSLTDSKPPEVIEAVLRATEGSLLEVSAREDSWSSPQAVPQDDGSLAVLDDAGIWDTGEKPILRATTAGRCPAAVSGGAAASSTGTAAIGCDDGSILWWTSLRARPDSPTRIKRHDAAVVALAVDERRVLSADAAQNIVWSDENRELWRIKRKMPVTQLAVSPDGEWGWVSQAGGGWTLLDLLTGLELDSAAISKRKHAAAFDVTGTFVLYDDLLRDLQRKETETIEGAFTTANDVILALGPRAKLVANGWGDGEILLDDWEGNWEIAKLPHAIDSLKFFPDGKRLAATAGDHAIVINIEAAQEARPLLEAFSGAIQSGASLSGPELDKLDKLIPLAQRRLTRKLTKDECQKYLQARSCPDLGVGTE